MVLEYDILLDIPAIEMGRLLLYKAQPMWYNIFLEGHSLFKNLFPALVPG